MRVWDGVTCKQLDIVLLSRSPETTYGNFDIFGFLFSYFLFSIFFLFWDRASFSLFLFPDHLSLARARACSLSL